jgi:hypothetical protein
VHQKNVIQCFKFSSIRGDYLGESPPLSRLKEATRAASPRSGVRLTMGGCRVSGRSKQVQKREMSRDEYSENRYDLF